MSGAEGGSHQGAAGRRRKPQDPDVKLSKALSWLLRHGAEKSGLHLQPGGFVYVDEVLKLDQFNRYSVEDIKRVVKNNDKQRYHIEEHPDNHQLRIRANQGHTQEVEGLDLTPITDASSMPVVVHGTYSKNWHSIQKQGLSRMKRTHIHCARGELGEDGVISGMRGSCDILVYIDLKKALEDNLQFFTSANNVILSPGDENGYISPKYFSKVLDRKTRKSLLH